MRDGGVVQEVMTQIQLSHALQPAQEPKLSGPHESFIQDQVSEAGQIAEGGCVSWSMAEIRTCEDHPQKSLIQAIGNIR